MAAQIRLDEARAKGAAMQFRKKPVVIEALKWDGTNIDAAMEFLFSGAPLPSDGVHVQPGIGHTPALGTLDIPTLEGAMTARAGDWIIKGVKGEFYPCKPDIFAATYEPAAPVVDASRVPTPRKSPEGLIERLEACARLAGADEYDTRYRMQAAPLLREAAARLRARPQQEGTK